MVTLQQPTMADLEARVKDLLPEWIDREPARWQQLQYALRRAMTHGPVFPTFESFIEWVDEDTSAEWEEGEVVFMSPASTLHQMLVGFLYAVLRAYVERHQLGVVLSAPFKMKLPGYGAEPDILFILKENEGRLRKTFLDGPADLVIEVVSPDSIARDRIKKYNDYGVAGVAEYWIIDAEQETAEFYRLVDGRYQPVETPEDSYTSATLPGFTIPLDWLRRNRQPALIEALRQMGIL